MGLCILCSDGRNCKPLMHFTTHIGMTWRFLWVIIQNMTEPKEHEKIPAPKLLIKKPPADRITRTDNDRSMIILGICIILFLVAAFLFSLQSNEKNAQPIKFKGPVEDPYKYGSVSHIKKNGITINNVDFRTTRKLCRIRS